MKPTCNEWALTLWPISRNLILYASLRGQYITVVYGYERSVELNTLTISSCQLPVFGRPSRGGGLNHSFTFLQWYLPTEWVMKNVTFKCFFTSFIFVIIICCLSLSQCLFSCSLLVLKPEIVKTFFFSLFLQLLRPRSSLLIYSSCYHGGVRWHIAQRGRYSNDDRICPCVLLLFSLSFFVVMNFFMNFSTFSSSCLCCGYKSVFVFTEAFSYPSA